MQFVKRSYFQLGILIFVYLLFLVMLGSGLATTLFLVLLLCACYIMACQHGKQTKLTDWLRVMIYAVLIYNIYYILKTLPTEVHIVRLFQPAISGLQLMRRAFVDYFWELLIIGVLAFVLIFNKPATGSFGIKKLISKFR